MNKKMKLTMAVALTAVMCGGVCFARGGGPGGPRGGGPAPRPAPMHRAPAHRPAPPPPPRHHHGSVWGRGGSNFWPGFVGGVIGGALAAPVVAAPAPVVVTTPTVVTTTPVVTTQNVWVEGRYIDQVQPNGTILRVWQPGHYETRQIAY